jgi:hypothetical protein
VSGEGGMGSLWGNERWGFDGVRVSRVEGFNLNYWVFKDFFCWYGGEPTEFRGGGV